MRKQLFLTALFIAVSAQAQDDLFSTLDESLPVSETSDFVDDSQEVKEAGIVAGDSDVQIYDFYRRRKPATEVEIPESPDKERLMWKLGNNIRNLNIPTGTYSVIRLRNFQSGYLIRFVGKLNSDGKHASVTEAPNEILPGDLVVKEKFQTASLPSVSGDGGMVKKPKDALAEVTAILEPGQDEDMLFSGDKGLIGAKFEKYKGGNSTTLGSVFTVRRKGEEIAKAVVVDSDLDLATLYVFSSEREVQSEDELFAN